MSENKNPFQSAKTATSELPSLKTLSNATKAEKLVATTHITEVPISTVVCQHLRQEFILRHKPYHLISNGVRLFGEPIYYSSIERKLALQSVPYGLQFVANKKSEDEKQAYIDKQKALYHIDNVFDKKVVTVSLKYRVQLSYQYFVKRFFNDSKITQYFVHSGQGKFEPISRTKVFIDDLLFIWSNPKKYFDLVSV